MKTLVKIGVAAAAVIGVGALACYGLKKLIEKADAHCECCNCDDTCTCDCHLDNPQTADDVVDNQVTAQGAVDAAVAEDKVVEI
jgi:hypothetical protein